MKTKLLSLALSVLLILSVPAATAATDSDAGLDFAQYQEAADTLYALGFSDSYTEDDLVNKRMTRAEFVTLMVRTLNRRTSRVPEEPLFYDVPLEHNAISDIYAAYWLGLINGSDGYFEPAAPITLEQAAKIIVVALGYKAQAEQSGGYPAGYFIVADRLGIMKGVEGAGKMVLRSGMALQMVFNALEVDLVQFLTIDGGVMEGYLTKGENILTEYHSLTKGEGVVTATPVSGLSSPEGTADSRVAIDHVIYKSGSSGAEKYLGYYISWYADEDSVLRYAHRSDIYNEITQVDIKDLAVDEIDSAAERFVYYDETGKKRNISVSGYADFLYNGVSTGSFDPALLSGEGYVTFIDNNADSTAEVVMIYAYTTMIADSVDKVNLRIFGKYGSGSILEMDDTSGERTVRILYEGRDVTLSSIQSMDVLSVFESINTTGRKHIQVVISRKTVVGQISSLDSDDTGVTIGEDSYDISAGFTNEAKPLLAGMAGNFYLDAYDRLAHFEATSDGEFNTFHYGYLIDAKTGRGLDTTVQVKLLTATNEVNAFDCSARLQVDGFRPKTGADALRQLMTEEGSYAQVVRYKMNEEKVITALDTIRTGPKDATVQYIAGSVMPEDVDNLTLDIPFPSDGTQWRWINTASAFGLSQPEVIVDAALTKVLVLPEKGTVGTDRDYEFTTRSHFIASDYYSNAYYNLSDFKVADLAVTHRKSAEVRPSEHIALVDKVVTAVNEAGDTVQRITMIYRGQLVDRMTREYGLANGIVQGDVIRFAANAANELTVIEKLADGNSVFDVISAGSGAGYFYANMNTYVGVIHQKEGSMILFSTSKDETATSFQLPFVTASAQYGIYMRKSGKVSVTSSTELDLNLYSRNPDAVIVLGCYGGRVEDIYILDMSS